MSTHNPSLRRDSRNSRSLRERYIEDTQRGEERPESQDVNTQPHASGLSPPVPDSSRPSPAAPSPSPTSRPPSIHFSPPSSESFSLSAPSSPSEIDLEITEGYWRNDESPLPLYEPPPVYTEPNGRVWIDILGVRIPLGRLGLGDVIEILGLGGEEWLFGGGEEGGGEGEGEAGDIDIDMDVQEEEAHPRHAVDLSDERERELGGGGDMSLEGVGGGIERRGKGMFGKRVWGWIGGVWKGWRGGGV